MLVKICSANPAQRDCIAIVAFQYLVSLIVMPKNLHILHFVCYIFMVCECASFSSNQTKQHSSWFQDRWRSFPFLPSSFLVAWQGELPCRKWDCECAFKQRGCCCATSELQEAEDQLFVRVMDMSTRLSQLSDSIREVVGTLEQWKLVEIVHRIKKVHISFMWL